jgi:hypothetical protein
MPDLVRIARAIATNQLARVAPRAYVRLTEQTGRGAKQEESPAGIATYFDGCVADYFAKLGVPSTGVAAFLDGKTLMEYGPGDLPGVAALMVARGASKVYCVDRFHLVSLSDKNVRVMRHLVDACTGIERERLLSCFVDPTDFAAGFRPERIEYLVRPSGLSQLEGVIDLVYSRAVLEHVNDLDATFADMVAALRPGAKAIHQVDLKSHGLHKSNALDFLECSPRLWSAMFSEKGVPNRWRVDKYRRLIDALKLRVLTLEPTALAKAHEVAQVRPRLAKPFRATSDDDLSWLGFWLVFEKPGA